MNQSPRKKAAPVLVLAVFITIGFCGATAAQSEKPENPPLCCTRELQKVLSAAHDAEVSRYNVFVAISVQPLSNKVLAAGIEGCPAAYSAVPDCEMIYVSKKLFVEISQDELLAILAHEVGHLANPKNSSMDINSEYFADEFAVGILRKLNVNPAALISMLKKCSENKKFYNKYERWGVRKRIERLEQMLVLAEEK